MAHRKPTGQKPPLAILPLRDMIGLARCFAFGKRKYGSPYNYKECALEDADEYVHATLRHLGLHQEGELLDHESGLVHVDHAITSLLMYRGILQKHGVLPVDPGVGKNPSKKART